MDKNRFSSISEEIKKVIKDELHGDFIPASPKDYPPLEVDLIDYDQQIDEKLFSEDDKCKNFERPNAKELREQVVDLPDRLETELELKYFLDGTFRTYYWGDVEIGNYSFPVILGETVVSIVRRENKDFSRERLCKKINIVLPPEIYAEIQEFRQKLQETVADKYPEINIATLERDPNSRNTKGDLKTSMLGKVRAILHEEEREEADRIARSKNEILVVDGDLRKTTFIGIQNTIGLAKSFSLKPVIEVPFNYIPLPKILRNLKKGQRTCVLIKKDEPQYKFWYIRLRNPEECENYWQGIVKVEVNLRDLKKPTDSFIDYVSQVSKLIYEERIPSSYPTKRWASHIYPIYVAEKLAKNSLTSPQVFRQLFKIK